MNGGQITTSSALSDEAAAIISSTRRQACDAVPFIFQFPATRSRRIACLASFFPKSFYHCRVVQPRQNQKRRRWYPPAAAHATRRAKALKGANLVGRESSGSNAGTIMYRFQPLSRLQPDAALRTRRPTDRAPRPLPGSPALSRKVATPPDLRHPTFALLLVTHPEPPFF